MPSFSAQVLAASAGRDRVSDGVKALALALVIVGHGLAWTITPAGAAVNTLEAAPWLFPLTWLLQILPLFFLVAGDRMANLAANPTPDGVQRRVARLICPAIPLLLVTLLAAAAIQTFADAAISSGAGAIPVQLLWFLGIYLVAIAMSPLLARLRKPWHFVLGLLAIGAVDLVRVNLWEPAGWLNLACAWLFFVALGMHLSRLRAVPRRLIAVGFVSAIAAAITLVLLGPYSAALISTEALPGISNLAPPTMVLVLAGIAQTMILLLAWPVLDRVLARDRVWVPVALFSSRAMGMYLLHMLLLALSIGIVLALDLRPRALSLGWWALHAIVLFIVVTLAWVLTPSLMKSGSGSAVLGARLIPYRLAARLRGGPVRLWLALSALAGLCLLMISESGLAAALHVRPVLGIPYLPVAAVVTLVLLAALSRKPAGGELRDGV
jgi:hypothetical protein